MLNINIINNEDDMKIKKYKIVIIENIIISILYSFIYIIIFLIL